MTTWTIGTSGFVPDGANLLGVQGTLFEAPHHDVCLVGTGGGGLFPVLDLLDGVSEEGGEKVHLVGTDEGEVTTDVGRVLAAELELGIGTSECEVVTDEDRGAEDTRAGEAVTMGVAKPEDMGVVIGGRGVIEMDDPEEVFAVRTHQSVLLASDVVAPIVEGRDELLHHPVVGDGGEGGGGVGGGGVEDLGPGGGVSTSVQHEI